jgi:CDP-glucose 4,6-dehydratase
MGGFDPYSASKGAAELIVSAYKNSFFENNPTNRTEIATARAGNVIGGGDWAKDRIVPDIIRALQKNKVVSIRNPNSVRSWQYVLELISGILWLAAKMYEEPKKNSNAWNFGPPLSEKSFTVKELVNSIFEEWGSDFSFEIEKNSDNMHESQSLIIDSSKSKKELGWETCLSFDETVSETVSWYKKYENDKSDIKNFTKKQIENYIIKAKRNDLVWTKS